jgi:hypothetical protein
MNLGLITLATNVGFSIPNIILLIAMLGCIVFYAKDFRLGVILGFFVSGLCFISFYLAGWTYTTALIICLVHLPLLALNILFVGQNSIRVS